MKLQKCTEPKHSWIHLKNVTKTSFKQSGSFTLTLKGKYKCKHCNTIKYGNPKT